MDGAYSVVRQISEADLDANGVLASKVTGRGTTSLVFALSPGDTSSKAVKSANPQDLLAMSGTTLRGPRTSAERSQS